MSGRLEVIAGPMFSGKSEELIRRLRRAQIAKLNVMSFKPVSDSRYHASCIASHSQTFLEAIAVMDVVDLDNVLSLCMPVPHVVGIDEVQFFDPKIIDVVSILVSCGSRVVVAGLDTDYRGEPFEPVPHLMAIADEVCKLTAVCMNCGADACHTYRKDKGNTQIVSVGALEAYEARCRKCFSEA